MINRKKDKQIDRQILGVLDERLAGCVIEDNKATFIRQIDD